MAPSLKPTGKNGNPTFDVILDDIKAQLLALPPQETVPPLRRLLPHLAHLESPAETQAFLAPVLEKASGVVVVMLLAAQGDSLQRAEQLAASLPDPDDRCHAWGAIARARAAHGQDPAAAIASAWKDARPALGAVLLNDLLAALDLDGALRVLRDLTPPAPDDSSCVALCEALYRAGRLAEFLPLLDRCGDILTQTAILRAALRAPVHARDLDGVFEIAAACPAAYRADLLEAAVLGWIDAGAVGVARRALHRWQSPSSNIRLGLLAMLGEGSAAAALKAELAVRLEVEEVAWHDSWRYRELGRACGWAGDLIGTLASLERIVDHEHRMGALLSAIRYAPLAIQEPLLCAARGLAASMQDDQHRAEAVGHLAAVEVKLSRKRAGMAKLEEASRLAAGIRRPRSNQGAARRAALESVIADQLAAEDMVGAFRTARKLRTRHMRNPHLAVIAEWCGEQGDLGGVVCCLENMAPGAERAMVGAGVIARRGEAEHASSRGGHPDRTDQLVARRLLRTSEWCGDTAPPQKNEHDYAKTRT